MNEERIAKLASSLLAALARTHGAGNRYNVALDHLRAAVTENRAKPAPGSPLPPGREAEIQKHAQTCRLFASQVQTVPADVFMDAVASRDFERARADRIEACLADVAGDDGYRRGVQDGVAKALAVVVACRDEAAKRRAAAPAMSLRDVAFGEAVDSLNLVAQLLRKEGGDQDALPHLASLARLRRLEQFVAWVAQNAMRAPGPNYEDLAEAARKALGAE